MKRKEHTVWDLAINQIVLSKRRENVSFTDICFHKKYYTSQSSALQLRTEVAVFDTTGGNTDSYTAKNQHTAYTS